MMSLIEECCNAHHNLIPGIRDEIVESIYKSGAKELGRFIKEAITYPGGKSYYGTELAQDVCSSLPTLTLEYCREHFKGLMKRIRGEHLIGAQVFTTGETEDIISCLIRGLYGCLEKEELAEEAFEFLVMALNEGNRSTADSVVIQLESGVCHCKDKLVEMAKNHPDWFVSNLVNCYQIQ